MTILVLIDAWFPFTGGAQVQIRNLKKILEKDYDCRYIVLHSPSSALLIRFVWIIWVIPQAIFLHFRHNFNLIHAHAYWPGVAGKILSKILKIPVVFTVHGSNLMDLKAKSPRAFLEKIILTKIKYDKVISVASNFLKYKNVNEDISVISNGVNVKKFQNSPPAEAQHLRAGKTPKLQTKDKDLKILFVGRLEEVKGVEYLIRAFERVSEEIEKTRLIIVGRGSEEKNLKKLAERLKIRKKIFFKSYLEYDDLVEQYLKADLFVLPSLSEGQPLTLLEAWAAKVPVVATTVGDNSLVVKEGVNGYLVKPEDSKELAKEIIRVLKNKNRKLMGEKGYKLVKENFSWKKCAQKTFQVYTAFAKTPSTSRRGR